MSPARAYRRQARFSVLILSTTLERVQLVLNECLGLISPIAAGVDNRTVIRDPQWTAAYEANFESSLAASEPLDQYEAVRPAK